MKDNRYNYYLVTRQIDLSLTSPTEDIMTMNENTPAKDSPYESPLGRILREEREKEEELRTAHLDYV